MAPAARRYFSHGGRVAYLARVPERRQIAPKRAKSISLIRRTGTRRALSIRARPGAFHREAGDIQFGYGANGKPYFADETHRWLRFNLSHSHGVALYAISAEREIGIDVEYVRRVPDVDVENIFSASEIAALKALPESVRPRAFFACWTRKEAYIKARGGGLSIPLKSFSVSLSPGEPAALLDASPPAFSRWSLREIAVDPRYAAAVAVEGSPSRIRYWEVRESDF